MLIMLPGPTNVHPRVYKAIAKPIIGHRGPEFHELYKRISENLKYVFQTGNDVFVLTSSGTGGVECAVSNIVAPNDKVVVPVNGVFSKRLSDCIRVYGGKPIEINVKWGTAPLYDDIKRVLEEEEDVKAIAVVYNETSTGAKCIDLGKIGELARSHDLLFIVDAISILGGDELPVDEWNIDVCITGSQKCLACPPGLSLISVSERALKAAENNTSRKTYYFDFIKLKQYHDKNETPFTPAVPLLYALDEALKMIVEEGLENRFERHRRCARAFYSALETLGFEIFPEREVRSNTVIVAKVASGVDDAELRRCLKERHGVVIAGGMGALKGKVIRIGCMGIISEELVLKTVSALEEALISLGYDVKRGSAVSAAREALA
ncbi:MAG: aminotransferase [Candidatus Methanomethylicota archaeon]|uniref:Aminotransferase n=1 Tax=Thermoproteota archaeon TaxID=2056631 RepID=A0A497F6J1_9CREN|nr:MAG: aminotransferase [Candidatus Verstraetearchaeota archaeon]RLE54931.1 MAG: aminotransferase [Candidatus Verstraetearchaeota archaeon]